MRDNALDVRFLHANAQIQGRRSALCVRILIDLCKWIKTSILLIVVPRRQKHVHLKLRLTINYDCRSFRGLSLEY
jgi:hypothetical protein